MISIYDGELIDILPAHLKTIPEYQALSYALKKQWQRLYRFAEKASIYAKLDNVDEKVLDILAVELRAQYYEDDFPVETKREIIRNTIKWNIKAGTVFAAENILEIIYGEGKEVDWYEYDGIPNHMRLNVGTLNTSDFTKIIDTIEKVKRKTARLDGIDMMIQEEQGIYFGNITVTKVEEELMMEPMDPDGF